MTLFSIKRLNIKDNKDEEPFKEIFDKYYQKLFHLAYFYLHSKEMAEEAVLDVFFSFWNIRERAHLIENIENYLYISTKYKSFQYLKKNTNTFNEIPLELYKIELIEDSTNPENNSINDEYKQLVQEAILSLSPKCREVFRLYFSDNLKQKQIAEILDISIKTVEFHIASAYKKIATFIQEKYNS